MQPVLIRLFNFIFVYRQNAWLWVCEIKWNPHLWREEYLSDRLNDCITYLLTCINEEELKQYFHDKINLFKNKDKNKLRELGNQIDAFQRVFQYNPEGVLR